MTAREFQALKKQWAGARSHLDSLYAGIQATLHNAHFRSREHHPEPWTPEMFLPGYKAQGQSWQDQKLILGATFEAKAAAMRAAATPEMKAATEAFRAKVRAQKAG